MEKNFFDKFQVIKEIETRENEKIPIGSFLSLKGLDNFLIDESKGDRELYFGFEYDNKLIQISKKYVKEEFLKTITN